METKIFGDKRIIIRELMKKDLSRSKKFQNYINSLIAERAKILYKTKHTIKDEKEWLKKKLNEVLRRKLVLLIAEHGDMIVGKTEIGLEREKKDHVGGLGISIGKGYRGIGLGKYLTTEVIKLAEKKLKPSPKIIKLEVFVNNKPAINLYKKLGFKIVARIPKQIQYKGKLIDEFIMLKFL